MINFDMFKGDGGDGTIIEPRKIFTTLTRHPRFKRPSDEQGEVLDGWFARRNEHDLTIKMNTGSGKTLVGLLALKSGLNEGIGPAIYITPDKYLTSQVLTEAEALGISTTDSENDMSFMRGESILVTNIRKVVNGRSVFGVKEKNIPLDAIVIDDAHACLQSIEEQFTIEAKVESQLYKDLWNLLSEPLRQYNPMYHSRLISGDPTVLLELPYWIWKDRSSDIVGILLKNKNLDDLQFKLDLLIDVVDLCQCAITARRIEIAPRCIPIDVIPSLSAARRKIFMTATLANDGILVTHFRADPKAISKPIKPKGAGDMGVRMIITPQELNRDLKFDDLKAFCSDVAKNRNVVVIVPSTFQANQWKNVAAAILNKDNIHEGIEKLKAGHFGLVVLINKYDGVDLPGTACEMLVLDGVPTYSSLIARVNAAALEGTTGSNIELVQRIEQGMGRGVRSSEDRCVVLLWGSGLAKAINFHETAKFFTEITKAQLKVARQLARQIVLNKIGDLMPVLNYSFNADAGWTRVSKEAIVQAPDTDYFYMEEYVGGQRAAFDFARIRQYGRSIEAMQAAINATPEDSVKGYLKQQLAEYYHYVDRVESQKILLSAVSLNNRVIKPIEGIEYKRLGTPENQFIDAHRFMSRFPDGNDLVLWINALLDDLEWDPLATKRFEAAVHSVGQFAGFAAQRPEVETGKGPDNLWGVGAHRYFVIECKSGATVSELISKSDCNQLLGSVSWFNQNYPPANSALPIMIHPKFRFGPDAAPANDFRIIDTATLLELKNALKSLGVNLGTGNKYRSRDDVGNALTSADLIAGRFEARFTRAFAR
ncbi:DEAD/DEAH box helicase [Mesorhizobium sp. M4A.F.Ca.ET.022.05.2.1]|uniref:DEAD/DEAH box helicase n=1 Tax=Mesorhizobium sp. M4A.F.Ca.ET.022.05.2.1 TaxID=2496653 RepID=UPI000FCA785E|nr:DEAD/DEAH box helicase [Mesorhizobium sp. M4A.F.Ca.ET.022.05.2.1]RVC79472.1 DEAD/DEAH box helicase [Mesorhizobium sp. M4A.F.Ca.ET.022.05.2.1]